MTTTIRTVHLQILVRALQAVARGVGDPGFKRLAEAKGNELRAAIAAAQDAIHAAECLVN